MTAVNWFPNYSCAGCGAEIDLPAHHHLCRHCLANLPLNPVNPVPLTSNVPQLLDTVQSYAPFIYAEPIRTLILRLKYDDNPYAAAAVAPYLAAVYYRFIPAQDYLIVPVPLARARQRQRGYNQSVLLARALADYLAFPIVTTALVRCRNTPKLGHLSATARTELVRDAFTVVRPELIKGRALLLLDDVYTTGATANACRTALLAAGAQSVTVLTVAVAQSLV